MTMFKKPRLIVDWVNVDQHHGTHIFSQELFFNVCFAVLFGSLRTQFVAEKDLIMFLREFLLIWTLISSGSDYATRFNDDDTFHILWWGGYGAGLVGTLMHIQNQLHYSLAGTQLWTAIAWFRVAAHLEQCRKFALINGCALILLAASIVGIGLYGLKDTPVCFMPALISPVTKLVTSHFLPHSQHLPMNIEYHLPKFQGMVMLIMGQLVIVAATPPRSGEGPHDLASFYRDAICAVFLLFSFKLIVTDCDTTTVENHALRRSKRAAITWLCFCQPALNLAVVTCSAGVSHIHETNNTGNPQGLERGIKLASFGSSGMFLGVLLSSMLHRRENIIENSRKLQIRKATWLFTLLMAALGCTLPAVLEIDPMPMVAVIAVLAAKIGWIVKSSVLHAREEHKKTHSGPSLSLDFRRSYTIQALNVKVDV